jgi:hypothetical protein
MARTILKSKRRVYLALASAGLLALIVVGTAYAITSSSFKYSSTKTGYVSVSAMDMAPDNDANDYFNDWSQGVEPNDSSCYNAGVNLPSGSKVKSVTFLYKSGPTSEFFGRFVRMRLSTGVGTDIISAPNPANDTGLPSSVTRNVGAANQNVSNSQFAYGIGVCPGATDGTFIGARIKYTYRNAGS